MHSAKRNISVCSKQATHVVFFCRRITKYQHKINDFKSKNILLENTSGKLSSFNLNKATDVRVTFFTGSQKTYVTKHVKSYFHLLNFRTERIFINTFTNCDSEPRTVDVAPLKFIVFDKPIVIEALCTP